jgi:hypothetical protein
VSSSWVCRLGAGRRRPRRATGNGETTNVRPAARTIAKGGGYLPTPTANRLALPWPRQTGQVSWVKKE